MHLTLVFSEEKVNTPFCSPLFPSSPSLIHCRCWRQELLASMRRVLTESFFFIGIIMELLNLVKYSVFLALIDFIYFYESVHFSTLLWIQEKDMRYIIGSNGKVELFPQSNDDNVSLGYNSNGHIFRNNLVKSYFSIMHQDNIVIGWVQKKHNTNQKCHALCNVLVLLYGSRYSHALHKNTHNIHFKWEKIFSILFVLCNITF